MTVDYSKTLDELEGIVWVAPTHDSNLVLACHKRRTTPLRDFTASDLRLMLLQRISVPLLGPIALALLSADPLLEATFYPGDLLHAFTQALRSSEGQVGALGAAPMLLAARAQLEHQAASAIAPDLRAKLVEAIDVVLSKPNP